MTTPEETTPETEVVETPAAEAPVAEAPAVEEPAAETDAAETDAAETTEAAEAPASKPARIIPTGKPIQTVGRRKQAIVRVRLMPGSGKFTLNGRSLEEYFPNKVHQQLIREPLVTVEKPESFDIFANLKGGGITGQAGALRLAIARALIDVEIDDRPALKKAGFLTRDPRVQERKKYGLKKARKAPQYSKR
ncbi:MAG TPA: 30S ribosomal protein S9 [Pseudonocardiaceae bacterium]|nr:30S ribosomal protein S9 [Pseudonocardiaceae bacterium]